MNGHPLVKSLVVFIFFDSLIGYYCLDNNMVGIAEK